MRPLKKVGKKMYEKEDILYLAVALLKLLPLTSRGLPYNYESLLKMNPKEALSRLRPMAERIDRIFALAKSANQVYFLSDEDWLWFLDEKTLINSLLLYFKLGDEKVPIPPLIDERGLYNLPVDQLGVTSGERSVAIARPFRNWLGEYGKEKEIKQKSG